jgi:YfiH family protein
MIMSNTPLVALEEPTLKAFTAIRHIFFTRRGGVSTGCYASLNCAYASKDDPSKVRENRIRTTTHLGLALESLVTVNNIHSNKVVVVDKPWLQPQNPEADAMVTQQRGIILGSDSADCPIVLLADVQAKIVGLAHAGWRGAKNGVLELTVKQMINLGARPHNIVAAISPCIAQDSYEVSDDFYKQFISDNPENKGYFKNAHKLNHFMFDLLGYVQTCLTRLNIKSIRHLGIDTYTDQRFFSCRRSFHLGEDDFGGQLSCIGLK